jgi:hypothetical protein
MTKDNPEPSYFAVIPAYVRYDKDLPDKAKLLFGEITALTNKFGYCYASNKYFSELYGCTERSISRLINKLADKNYFKIFIDDRYHRKIYPNENPVLPENDRQNCPPPSKVSNGVDKNVRNDRQNCLHNNIKSTKKNNTSKVVIPSKLINDKFVDKWHEWLSYRAEIKKKLYPSTANKQLEKLEKWGIDKAIKSIDISIEKGWQGLFEPKEDQPAPKKSKGLGFGSDPH